MAPSMISPTPSSMPRIFSPGPRRISGFMDNESMSHSFSSARVTSKKWSRQTNITNVVDTLKRQNGELGGFASSPIFNGNNHQSLLDWIKNQRMSLVPAEGSTYDKVLAWAQLFVERIHSFTEAMEPFAGDSFLAADLAYSYCDMLFDLGKDNWQALIVVFGFFYSTSMTLANLLERTALFEINQDICDQLVLALGDLVTLVAAVSTHFHKTTLGMKRKRTHIDIYRTFPVQIQTYRERCEKITIAMWRHQLRRESVDSERVAEVQSVKSWLSPDDRVLTNIAESVSHLAHEREELTCLWMYSYLARFLKSNLRTLCLTGKPGSGRTVLASVIVDHLQHPIGGVNYNALFIPLNSRIPAETSARAVARTILYQLFEKRIGNVQLFQILTDAYQRGKLSTTEEDYDQVLWTALEEALAARLPGAKDLILVVDGVDEASCGEATLMQKLTSVITTAANVKLIALGAQKPPAAQLQYCVPITEDVTFEDVSAVIRGHFRNKAFESMSDIDQETIINRIADAADSSFLWAKLAVKRARVEEKPENLRKVVDALVNTNPTIVDFVLYVMDNAKVTPEAKHMLLWLATVERPLQIKELALLSSIQVDKQTIVENDIEVLGEQRLGPVQSLVFVRDGLVYLRHGLIRTAILEVFAKGKLVPNVKDRHADLVTRLLIYIKCTVTEQREPSLTSLNSHDTNSLLNKHPLLDFALRYWPLHFRQTTVFAKDGRINAAKEFGKYLPVSTAVVLLQNTVWERLPTAILLFYRLIIVNVFREILKDNNVVTFQSVIFLAQLYIQLGKPEEAIPLFYQATQTSSSLLTVKNHLTMQLTKIFLELTQELITNSNVEIMVQREKCLILLIECYKAQENSTSENVVAIMKQLSEHYSMVKEEKKAQEILKNISIITDAEYDTNAQGTTSHLDVALTARQETVIQSGTLLLFGVEHDEVIESHWSFEESLQQAEKYAAEGRYELSERTFVEIWQRVTEEHRIQATAVLEEKKMKAILAYTSFLRSQKRDREVSSIVSSFWQDAQHSTVTESSISYYQQIAQVMKTVGLSTTALAVFKHCSEYYQSTNRTQTSTYKEIQQSIESTSKEVIQSVSSSASVTSESTLEEMIIEKWTTTTTVDQSSFKATESLVQLYMSQHRWRDSSRVLKQILRGIWPSLFAPLLEDVALPANNVDNAVSLAERLSECYHFRRRLTKEQDLRVRIYRALRFGRNVEDKLRQHGFSELLKFFKSSSQTDMIINMHQELLNDYIAHYGPDDKVVITQLWTLAELTRPRPIFIDYYTQIIQKLNKGSPTCHPDALEALIIVSTELWNQGRSSDALHHYRVLFQTFLDQQKPGPRFQDHDFVQQVFDRYTQCLRATRAEFTIIHKVTVSYQTKCKTAFGMSASVTVKATWTLAKLCQESRRYEAEAIGLYKELLNVKSDVVNHEEITSTLDAIYEEQAAIVSSATREKTVSTEQVHQALEVVRKRVSTMRQSYGWAHVESLTKMEEMVKLYVKVNETKTAVNELQQATVQILSSETSITTLSTAAASIAASYVAVGQTEKATELSEEIYRQAILKDFTNAESVKFNLSSKEHHSLVFLAQLQHSLRRSSSVTEILASLSTEYVYFEEFRKQTKSKSSTLHSVTLSASRLHQFLVKNDRQVSATRVFADLKSYFVATEGKRIKVTESAQVEIFLRTMLDYLTVHRSQSFVRSVGIVSNSRVVELLQAQKLDAACNLALASFRYIIAQEGYRSESIVKFIFTLGMTISGRGLAVRIPGATNKKLLETSATILQEALRVIKELNINLAQADVDHLNSLVGILGEQQDYQTLAWLLTGLWNSHEVQRTWQSNLKLALGRRFIMVRYLVGDLTGALRLAEDIVYNCRRVHGPRHPSTLEMSVLLSQVYTGVAERYLAHKDGSGLAKRFYKKSATLHENILRAFSDPTTADLEYGMDASMSLDGHSAFEFDLSNSTTSAPALASGEYVRQHFQLLKLSAERLGDWPKDYTEYERLNADLYREFPEDLAGFEGVEKWNLKSFGGGKASGTQDQVDLHFKDWQLFDAQAVLNGAAAQHENGVEEEL